MTHRTNARLTKKQLYFINLLAKGTDFDEAAVQSGIAPSTLRKWLSSEPFTAELAFRRDIARRQSELLLGRFATTAASKLIALLESEKEEIVRKACLDILNLTDKQTENASEHTPPKPIAPLDSRTAEKLLNLLAEQKRAEIRS